MLIKAGVDISRLNRPIRRALNKIRKCCLAFNEELVITSTFEANHSASSLHYANDAIDIRNPKSNNATFLQLLSNSLGKDFDVVQEKDHIHIEYDPQG